MINNKRLPELHVDHVLFYYFDHTNTVCLLIKDNKLLARGVSMCSVSDQFVKKTGRDKALGRAVKAAVNQHDSDIVARSNTTPYILYKALFMPEAYRHEKVLIDRYINKNNKHKQEQEAMEQQQMNSVGHIDIL